ncbi:hypothetical protein K439DRAFT_1617940 [Ramaria rubella]|nr:hypothetical protein K439DRAFT_1617940 [Ramaria rubella]
MSIPNIDVSKFTVAKLRALCKEKGLSGYSKLPKNALLEKLGSVKTYGKLNVGTDIPVQTSSSHINSATVSLNAVIGEDQSRLKPPQTPGPQLETNETQSLSSVKPTALITNVEPLALTGAKRSSQTAFPSTSQNASISTTFKKQKTTHPTTLKDFKVPIDLIGFSYASSTKIIDTTQQLNANQPSQPSTGCPALMVSCSAVDAVKKTLRPIGQINTAFSNSLPNVPTINPSSVNPTPLSPLRDNNLEVECTTQSLSRSSSPCLGSTSAGGLIRPKVGLSVQMIASGSTPLPTSMSTPKELPIQSQKTKFKAPRPSSNYNKHHTQVSGSRQHLTPAFTSATTSKRPETSILSSLKHITFPPSMSQRKRLPLLSLALSYLNNEDRNTCIFVSKQFRYAVYLSARDILNRSYSGKRLASLMQNLSLKGLDPNMADLWPYLRLRQREAFRGRRIFERGWVATFLRDLKCGGTSVITEKLWASPDYAEQLAVIQRFIQTRICFALSLYGMSDLPLERVVSTVVDAQEVLANEIWSVSVTEKVSGSNGSCIKTYYVLYHTCEVIGHSTSDDTQTSTSSLPPLRADWNAYLALRLTAATTDLYPPLSEHIRGTNTDDFERGVAKAWLKRLRSQGEDGREKKKLAEKYILSCVVGDSISGPYKSTTTMAREFAGIPRDINSETKYLKNHPTPQVNLFIPERHNVESVHFSSPRGPFHPSLALVQTSGRQEGSFVLRENGIVIGEDEQIPEVWMRLLGCTSKGLKDTALPEIPADHSIAFYSAVRRYATRRPERPPLKIKDPLWSSSNATLHQITPELTFIHRPPPTAPSPFSLTTAPSSPLLLPPKPLLSLDASSPNTIGIPPPVWKPREQRETKLTEEQIAEIRRLRESDPLTHTRNKLAKQFGCVPSYIPMIAPLSKTEMHNALARRDQIHEANRSRWGERKAMVVAIRQKRRTLW